MKRSLKICTALFIAGSAAANVMQAVALRQARTATAPPIDNRRIYFDAARGAWIEANDGTLAPRAQGITDLDVRHLAHALKDGRHHD